MWRDDDDEPLSNADALQRADHNVEKSMEDTSKAKGQLNTFKRQILRSRVGNPKKEILKKEAQRDEKTNPDKKEPKLAASPKSDTEMADDAVQQANEKANPDREIQRGKVEQAAKDASDEEYQSDAG